MSSDEGDRIEELEARIEELEAQDSLTSGTVPISRRGLLQGGAALGIGALGGSVLGGGNSGRVAAQTASGQVGRDSDRVDVYGNLVDAVSVNAREIKVTGGSFTVNVPTDYNTLAAAIADLGEIVLPEGELVTINIESEHELSESMRLENEDLSHIRVTSEDNTVYLTSDFGSPTAYMRLYNTTAPIWDVFVDGRGKDTRLFDIREMSSVWVEPGSGCQNFNRGAEVHRRSNLIAEEGIFRDNLDRGVSVTRQGFAYVENGDLSGNDSWNLRVGTGYAMAKGANLTNGGTRGLSQTGGYVDANGCDVSGSGEDGIFSGAGVLNANGVTANNCVNNALLLRRGRYDVSNATIDGSGDGIVAMNSATVAADDSTITNCGGYGAYARTGSSVTLDGGSVSNCDSRGVASVEGASISAYNAESTGNTNSDLMISRGGIIQADGCSTTNSTGGDPHENDMNRSPNTVHGSGIIFAESTET